MKKNLSVLILLLLVTGFAAAMDPSLAGTWTHDALWGEDIMREFFVFNEDGTGEWYINDRLSYSTFTWETRDDIISIHWPGEEVAVDYDYVINEDGTLTVTQYMGGGPDNYDVVTYVRRR
jgi:hypothetical protein